jgi:hypothetical protein
VNGFVLMIEVHGLQWWSHVSTFFGNLGVPLTPPLFLATVRFFPLQSSYFPYSPVMSHTVQLFHLHQPWWSFKSNNLQQSTFAYPFTSVFFWFLFLSPSLSHLVFSLELGSDNFQTMAEVKSLKIWTS